MTTDVHQVDAAYAQCEEITRREARNFSYGIRLLPDDKRRAMSAIYALARRIDDIGDGDAPADTKLAALADVRMAVHAVIDGHRLGEDPVLVALGDAAARFPVPLAAFDDLIEGCARDVHGATYETYDDLVDYCRLVAGSIGRLSLGVFDCSDPTTATRPADDLGVALQLTNILRDVREDRLMGRVYLPAEDLDRFGCAPDASGPRDAMSALVAFEVERAEAWFGRGFVLLGMIDRRSRACVGAMAGIYHRLLARIAAEPETVLDGRLALPGWEKAIVAARSLLGVTR